MRDILRISNFYILIYGLIFVVFFYNYIDSNIGFSYIDEIFVLLLFLFYVIKSFYFKKISKEFFACICVFLFYLGYSIYISVNVSSAVYMDFLIQIKPYISFFTVYSMPIFLNDKQKNILKCLCIILAFLLLFISVQGMENMVYIMGHPSRVASTATILGCLYLYLSSQTRKDIVIMFLILSIGLLSFRYKMFGFFIVALFVISIYRVELKFKISLKTIILGLLIGAFVVVVLYDKIYNYAVIGSDEENLWTRTALYLYQLDVLNKYFPFGSGFGTYATWASGVYYSPIYSELGIDHLYGMSPDYYNYIADTYFPVLAQFGYCGILLFILFWRNIYMKAKAQMQKTGNILDFKIILLIIIFFFIESLADSTLTSNRGVFMMIILAMYLSNIKKTNNENTLNRRVSL